MAGGTARAASSERRNVKGDEVVAAGNELFDIDMVS